MTDRIFKKPNLKELVSQGRTPIIVEDWVSGPFLLVPPADSEVNEIPVNEQTGYFENGYGNIYQLTPDEANRIKSALTKE